MEGIILNNWDFMPDKVKERYNWQNGKLYIGKKEIANFYIKVMKCQVSSDGKEYVQLQYIIDDVEEVYENWTEFDEKKFLASFPPDVCKNKCIVWSKTAKGDLWILLQMQLINHKTDGWLIDELGWNQINNRWIYCTGDNVITPIGFEESVVTSPALKDSFQIRHDVKMREEDILKDILELIFLRHPIPVVCLLYQITSLLRQLFFYANVPPQFVLYISGSTGTFKTTTANYFFDIYNKGNGKPFASADLSSSEAALETKISEFKDCVFLLDDLSPSHIKSEMRKKETRVNNFIRTVSNCGVRFVQSGNSVKGKEIQCGIVLTAEYLPEVESIVNRTIILDMNEFPLNHAVLDFYTNKPLLVHNFSQAFLKWSVKNADKICEWIRDYWYDMRDRSATEAKLSRLENSYNILRISLNILIKYLRDNDICTKQIPKNMEFMLEKIIEAEIKILSAIQCSSSNLSIGREIIKMIQTREIIPVMSIYGKNGAKADCFFLDDKKYLFLSCDLLVDKIRERFHNAAFTVNKVSKSLNAEGLLAFEDKGFFVKRHGLAYYRINLEALAELAGIDADTLVP